MSAERDVAAEVRRIVRRLAAVPASDPLADDRKLTDAGYDSVRLLELVLECEATFGVPVADELLCAGPLTVGRLIAHVRDQPPSGDGG
jgi:acyl carrier protein